MNNAGERVKRGENRRLYLTSIAITSLRSVWSCQRRRCSSSIPKACVSMAKPKSRHQHELSAGANLLTLPTPVATIGDSLLENSYSSQNSPAISHRKGPLLRYVFLAIALAVSPAYAAPILLQTIEYTPKLDARPTENSVVFAIGADTFDHYAINYVEGDLGVTTFVAPTNIVQAFNTQLHKQNIHRSIRFSFEVGEYLDDGVLDDFFAWPLEGAGMFDGPTYAFKSTPDPSVTRSAQLSGLDMSVSPWTQVNAKWLTTVTVRMYGYATPEPSGWVCALIGASGLIAWGRRAA
jgi:hypothetical protein